MRSPFLQAVSAKKLLTINLILAIIYFVAITLLFQRGNIYLFSALIAGEVFHVWQAITFIHAVWGTKVKHEFSENIAIPVDIYVTVAGEPKDVVEQTIRAALIIDYPHFNIFILNDGRVAKKSNWQEMEDLARTYHSQGVRCITRTTPGGAKAGNINHALTQTTAAFVAILDCDHIPTRDFLKRMMGYFVDERVGFVQSPQYYRNHTASYVANAAWQQQTLFFGPICRGKDRTNSMFMCGTNMIIRRQALESVGGMQEASITEDLLTSLLVHAKGWRSVYVPRILAKGLAPEDLGSYWQQQARWARGSLEVLIKYNPLTLPGLSGAQRLQYLASVSFYLTGLVVLIDAALPIFYLYWGIIPVSSATMALALIFIPYIFITLYVLQLVSNFAFSFRAIAFSLAAWPIHMMALLSAIFRIKSSFKVTSKENQEDSYLRLASLHIIYSVVILVGIGLAIYRDGISPSLITNASWGLLYIALFLPFIRAAMSARMAAALPQSEELPKEELTP
jgi:cellulose synthase (UDP-forming)